MMRIVSLLSLCFSLVLSTCYAQQEAMLRQKWNGESKVHANPLVPYKPHAYPDRIVVLPTGTDGREVTITWRTDTTVTTGVVEYAKADSVTFRKKDRVQVESTTTFVEHMDYPMYFHKAVIRDIEPGTTYQYRVGSNPVWSSWTIYQVADYSTKDTISFLYFGDAQNGIYDYAAKLYNKAYKQYGNVDFAIHAGDLINHANNDYEWAEWHAATAALNRSIPMITTPGNHEYLKNLEGKKVKFSDYWPPTFPFPYEWEQGPYVMDVGFVRFAVMNSNQDLDKQGKWLDSLLSETTQDWVVIVSHHPVFSGAKDRQNDGLLENWLPVIEKYKDKIGLVLQGHDHTYARGGLVGAADLAKPAHPVLTVAVVGDKYYTLDRQDWMHVGYDRVSSFQHIVVTKKKIFYKAYSETGKLIDSFELRKGKVK